MKLLRTYNNSKSIITASTWYRRKGYYLVNDPNQHRYGINDSVSKYGYDNWVLDNEYKLIPIAL